MLSCIKKAMRTNAVTRPLYRKMAQRYAAIKLKKRKKAFRTYGEDSFRLAVNTLHAAGIDCFPAFGTLLGLIRDGRLIPHDLDLDFGVIADGSEYDWDRLKNALIDAGFHILRWYEYENGIGEIAFASPMSRRLNIDFFLFKRTDGGMVTHTCYRLKDRKYNNNAECTLFEEKFPPINQFAEETHLGVTVSIPRNAKELLECSYTSAWQIPDASWNENNKPNRKEKEGVLAIKHEQ